MQTSVKPKSGEGEYEGWCWPGSSSWTDFFNPASWDWWKSMFKIEPRADGKFSWTKSTTDIHIWNDMNEVGLYFWGFAWYMYVEELFSNSLRFSMDLKSLCQRITSTTAVGNTATYIILTECSSWVLSLHFNSNLTYFDARQTKPTKP